MRKKGKIMDSETVLCIAISHIFRVLNVGQCCHTFINLCNNHCLTPAVYV